MPGFAKKWRANILGQIFATRWYICLEHDNRNTSKTYNFVNRNTAL